MKTIIYFGILLSICLAFNSNAQISVSFTVTNVTCFGGNDGVAIANPSGGTTPYTYSWSITPAASASQQTFTGLSAGYYAIKFMDASGQQVTSGCNVNEPTALDLKTHYSVDVSCFRCSDGAATVDPSGGVSPYAYSWNDGPTTQDRYQLGAGGYEVTVTDANGCSAQQQFIITEPSADMWLMTGNSDSDPSFQFAGTDGVSILF